VFSLLLLFITVVIIGIVLYVHFLTRERGAPDQQVETNKQIVKKNPNKPKQILKEGRVEDLFQIVNLLSVVV